MKKLSLIVAAFALVLSACGGSDSDDYKPHPAPPVTPVPPPPPPAPVVDAFFTSVKTSVATESDSAEPTSIDGVVSTMPEDTEPAAL